MSNAGDGITTVLHAANAFGLPLHDVVVPGVGFALGPGIDFTPAAREGDTFVATALCGLRVESTVDRAGDAWVVRHTVRNTSQSVSPPVSVLEPIHLLLTCPWRGWRLLTAHGGTCEHCSPPLAFGTREVWDAGDLQIESHALGRSSNRDLPLLLAASREHDAGLFAGMEWSAHWYIRWQRVSDEAVALRAGVKVSGMTLEPGEAIELPPVHLGFFSGGLEEGTNALRRHIYEQVCPRHMGGPALPSVTYDSWFGIENAFTADLMRAQADRAAELGVEVFVHDAAWFRGGFPDGVGNWAEADPAKWPQGLGPLAEHVRRKGMQFGLWFEIERAADGTQARREHPEFFLPPGAHLNLARRDAQDWCIETVGRWVRELDLRWIRWDYNIEPQPFWNAADPTGKIQFAYVAGLYRVLDALMAGHPALMIEACASGGRRIDLGIIRRAHAIWISDETMRPYSCRWMQARANRFLPGHLLNSSVAVPRHAGDGPFDDAAVFSRMLGKLSFDGDVASWSPALAARVARHVDAFKRMRHLFVQDFRQLLPAPQEPGDWDAVQFSSRDGAEHALFVFAGERGGALKVQPAALLADATYRVTRISTGRWRIHPTEHLRGRGVTCELGPFGGEVFHLRATAHARTA